MHYLLRPFSIARSNKRFQKHSIQKIFPKSPIYKIFRRTTYYGRQKLHLLSIRCHKRIHQLATKATLVALRHITIARNFSTSSQSRLHYSPFLHRKIKQTFPKTFDSKPGSPTYKIFRRITYSLRKTKTTPSLYWMSQKNISTRYKGNPGHITIDRNFSLFRQNRLHYLPFLHHKIKQTFPKTFDSKGISQIANLQNLSTHYIRKTKTTPSLYSMSQKNTPTRYKGNPGRITSHYHR